MEFLPYGPPLANSNVGPDDEGKVQVFGRNLSELHVNLDSFCDELETICKKFPSTYYNVRVQQKRWFNQEFGRDESGKTKTINGPNQFFTEKRWSGYHEKYAWIYDVDWSTYEMD